MSTRKKPLDDLLTEVKIGRVGVYGSRLKGLYLYKSCARGEEDEESDLDVLVVLEHFDHYATEVDRTGELVAGLSLVRNDRQFSVCARGTLAQVGTRVS